MLYEVITLRRAREGVATGPDGLLRHGPEGPHGGHAELRLRREDVDAIARTNFLRDTLLEDARALATLSYNFV